MVETDPAQLMNLSAVLAAVVYKWLAGTPEEN
jgi:hypothetical protein